MNGNVQNALRGVKEGVVGFAKFAWLTVRSIRPLASVSAVLFYAAMFIVASDPAAAATPKKDPTTLADFMGCATFDWASTIVPAAKEVTGMISSIGYIIVAIVALIIGIGYLLAGRRSDRMAGVQQAAKNAGIGTIIIVFGVPLVVLVLGGVTFFCTQFIAAP